MTHPPGDCSRKTATGWCRLATVLLFAALSAPCAAQPSLGASEQEIIGWYDTRDAGILYLRQLTLTITTDEHVRRRLLLDRCDNRIFRGADRLADERYLKLVQPAAAALKEMFAKEMQGRRLLFDPALAALILSYRKADQASQKAWMAYMKTPQAAEGRDWAAKLESVADFQEGYAMDISTGASHASWLHWYAEYLRAAGLFDAFVRAANDASPGLGKQFAAFVASPFAAARAKEQRIVLEALGRELNARMNAIAAGVRRQAPAQADRLAREWSEHPVIRRMKDAQERILGISNGPHRSADLTDAEVSDFLNDFVPVSDTDAVRLTERVVEIVRTRVEAGGGCGALR